jgi:hypothetical protein
MARLSDTSPEARRVQLEALRRLSGSERVAMAFEMSESARALTEAGIRDRHPDWSDEQVHTELMVRMLGRRLASKVSRTRPVSG